MEQESAKNGQNSVVKLTVETLKKLEPRQRQYSVNDSEVRGLQVRVMPSGAKTFSFLYLSGDGRRRRIRIGNANTTTLAQARKSAMSHQAAVTQGGDPQAEKKEARAKAQQEVSLETFIEQQYLPYMQKRYKRGANQAAAILRYPDTLLGTRLSDITQAQVERVSTERLAMGRTPATVNRYQSALKAALNRAVEWGLLESNPLARLRNATERGRERVRFLDEVEERRLLEALDAREQRRREARDSHNAWLAERGHALMPRLDGAFTDYFKPLVLTALHTGLRRGELFALRWEDIDLDDRVLYVRASTAKSGRPREVPLNATAHDVLSRWRAKGTGSGQYATPH